MNLRQKLKQTREQRNRISLRHTPRSVAPPRPDTEVRVLTTGSTNPISTSTRGLSPTGTPSPNPVVVPTSSTKERNSFLSSFCRGSKHPRSPDGSKFHSPPKIGHGSNDSSPHSMSNSSTFSTHTSKSFVEKKRQLVVYGRHGNRRLFGDISFTGTPRKFIRAKRDGDKGMSDKREPKPGLGGKSDLKIDEEQEPRAGTRVETILCVPMSGFLGHTTATGSGAILTC